MGSQLCFLGEIIPSSYLPAHLLSSSRVPVIFQKNPKRNREAKLTPALVKAGDPRSRCRLSLALGAAGTRLQVRNLELLQQLLRQAGSEERAELRC